MTTQVADKGEVTLLKTIFAIITTVLVTLAVAIPSYSQQSNEKVRIGFLGQGTPNLYVARVTAFKNELGRRGYVEGRFFRPKLGLWRGG